MTCLLHVLRDLDSLLRTCTLRGWLRFVVEDDAECLVQCRILDTRLRDVAAVLASTAYITALKDVTILPRDFLLGAVAWSSTAASIVRY